MSFEQDTYHQHIEELEQHQKKKENAQFQQDLDEIIARLENEQFQKELDDIIERLDQQSQQLPSTDQEPSSHDSITEGEPEQLYSLEKQTQTFDDQFISHQEENTEEQRSQNQNLEKIAKLSQEGQETTKDQNEELDHLQKMKENEQFQKDLDAIIDRLDQASHQPSLLEKEASSHESVTEEKSDQHNSLEQSTQTFDELIFHHAENMEKQGFKNQVSDDKLILSVNQKIKTHIHSPKSIEKEWNKYVLMGKPVPEEFQKKVFQQYDSGLLKNAGLIQKDGKWLLETAWETAPIVKSFIENPHIRKSFAFQLWAEFKTEKPLHYVQGKLNRNALYYSIELKKSSNLPHELNGKTVYVRNTKNFFKHGHSTGYYLQTTVKSFETSFLKKITNWGIPTDKYKVIRDEIFQQFSEKYGDSFVKVMVMRKRPMVFIRPYDLDSLEKSFIKCFVEYFSEGSRLWKFKNSNGKHSFIEYYQYHDFRSLAVLNRLGKREIPKINEISSPFVILGKECLETNDSSKYIEFAQKWNEFVNINKVTDDMWIIYNKIQKSWNYPLRRFKQIKQINSNQYKIEYYYDLANNFENLLERRGRFPTSLYETWFIFRDIKKGFSPFIEIKIMNPLTSSNEQYYLPNIDYHWNTNPAHKKSSIQKTNKDRTGIRMVIDVSMEEIPINDSQTKMIRNLIIEELKLKGFSGREKADVWFKHIYKMKYNNTLVDEILEQYFWREYDSNRLWEDQGYLSRTKHLHELISHYKRNGRKFKNFSKDLVDLAITDKFKVALVDKSDILEGIFRDLREYTGINKNISKEIFWNSVKDQVSTQRLARIIQKNKIRKLFILNSSYSIKEARLDYHPDITSNPNQFWNESLNNGVTRFSAALIQSRKIRSSINKITEGEQKFGALNLTKITSVEDHWGRVKSNGNVITYPDCISYEITEKAKKGKALEFIQNKIAREISGGDRGNLPVRDYFLDFFKSIGNRNDETGVLKFQLELIPKGETLGGLINDQSIENLCIISYWGKSTKEIQRIGDITNAFVLGRFEEKITSKNELVNFIMSKLKQGENALNGTKLESVSKKIIEERVSSLEPLENLTPTTFYKNWFIEIMRRYEKDLKSDI